MDATTVMDRAAMQAQAQMVNDLVGELHAAALAHNYLYTAGMLDSLGGALAKVRDILLTAPEQDL